MKFLTTEVQMNVKVSYNWYSIYQAKNNTKVLKAYSSIKQISQNRYLASWNYAVGLLIVFKHQI